MGSETINVFLDDPDYLYPFDDFSCEPSDCCKLTYSILFEDGSEVPAADAVLIPGTPNNLNFKYRTKHLSTVYYITATSYNSDTSLDSTGGDTNEKKLNVGVSATASCRPLSTIVSEGANKGGLGDI